MTREEARQIFLSRGYVEVEGGTLYDPDKWREACVVISEWLEQEPCENAINRNDTLHNIDKKVESYRKILKHPVVKRIMDMDEEQEQIDSVTPQPKMGRWIFEGNQCFSCSSCGRIYTQKIFECLKLHKYDSDFPNNCPNCGTRMVEPQESEE